MRAVQRQSSANDDRCLRIGLVNNMPDAALERTEKQFRTLLGCAAPDIRVQWFLFSLGGVPRDLAGRRFLEIQGYRSAAELPNAGMDALVVTGTEPREAELSDEPYWSNLTGLFDWLAHENLPSIFSCLATHAAVLHFDDIRRVRLREKRFGVFEHFTTGRNPLTEHLPPVVAIPHSRCNDVPAGALARCGYRILTESPEAGAGLFVGRERGLWLFCQGHPEYDASTLGREYARDVRRFLSGQRETYPGLPQNYFAATDADRLAVFKTRAEDTRDIALMEQFPVVGHLRADTRTAWPPAGHVFRSWLQQLDHEKQQGRARMVHGFAPAFSGLHRMVHQPGAAA